MFADHSLVAPYDLGIPEVDIHEMLAAVHEASARDGVPIEPRLRPEEISHAAFEDLWEQWALPRLRELAEVSSG